MKLPRLRVTVRGMILVVGLTGLILAAARYALGPGANTLTVVNRSGRSVSQVEVIVRDPGGFPMTHRMAFVPGDLFGFRNLADGSTATAAFRSYGIGTWCRAPRTDSFLLRLKLEDGTSVQGGFGFRPEPGSRTGPLFIITERGDLMLTARH